MTVFIATLMSLATTSIVYSQSLRDEIPVYATVVVFDNPVYDSLTLIEFPFSLDPTLFDKPPDSLDHSGYARIFAQVDLINVEGKQVDSNSLYFLAPREPAASDSAGTIRVFNRLQIMAATGIYSARLTVIDAVSKRKGERFFADIIVEANSTDRLRLGGLHLAHKIEYVGDQQVAHNAHLIRNGYRITPNCLATYGTNDSTAYIYGELYNLDKLPDSSRSVNLTLTAYKDSLRYRMIGGRRLAVEGDAIVIAESFDISGWTPGEYTLRVSISAPESEIADSADLPIRIVTPVSQQATLAQSVLPSRYDSLNLEDRINLLKYQLTPNEKMTLERLTSIGQENFIRQFWRDHAVPPQGSARNREELVQWYDHVARAFADNVSHKSGWATDRGRVYLTYGPPSEVEEFPAPITGPPFEVWFYRQLREGKVFVFVDWSGSHDYRMEHSDVLGEKFSQDWDDRIKQGLLERY